MRLSESLEDVAIRERQLAAHILQSSEYRKRADRDLKRLVTMLYLAISLLLLFQGLFTFHAIGQIPINSVTLMTVTSILGILNCLLLIKTKSWLYRLNEAWLAPGEKLALETLKTQRQEILTRLPRHSNGDLRPDLN